MRTPRILIGLSVLILICAALLGLHRARRTAALPAKLERQETARKAEDGLRTARETELRDGETAVATARFTEAQSKVASTQAELTRALTEKEDLDARLRTSETEVVQLRIRVEEARKKCDVPELLRDVSAAELRAQLGEARKQLDAAKREKASLSEKIRACQDQSSEPATAGKKSPAGGGIAGIHGTVLAVNRAYNFVVLSLGGKQGVEQDAEMLVLRTGSFIGKIRISSVEPSTSIGDILGSSLARGVQVQPGDIVIYAGTKF